jgi:hypothetical protein
MTKEHLDLFALAPGAPVSRGFCDFPGYITCSFMNASGYFPESRISTTARL